MKRIILVFCLLHAATAAYAGSLKDAKWNALIAEAVKHAGIETISGKTGSYVFSMPAWNGHDFHTQPRQQDQAYLHRPHERKHQRLHKLEQ
ncbi:MAG: hypothetical protein ACREC0_04455 [Methylocella sp.]